jgi:predicted alpha/beta superfamily hydrolase
MSPAFSRWSSYALAVSFGAALGCAASGPAPAASTPDVDPVPAHESFTMESRALGEARLVHVSTPRGYSTGATPPGRYPVLYMPDGGLDEDFPHVVRAVEALTARGKIRPVIVVGIPNTQRRRDLTPPTQVPSDRAIAPQVGGSEAFRRFIREELIPEIDRRYRTTSERAIIGESLAGLFVIETLLEEPSLFRHYAALDPSLWWNAGGLVDFAATRLHAFDPEPRSLYMASSQDAEIRGGPSRLAEVIRSSPPPGLRWRYTLRRDLTHATIFSALELEALEDALR